MTVGTSDRPAGDAGSRGSPFTRRTPPDMGRPIAHHGPSRAGVGGARSRRSAAGCRGTSAAAISAIHDVAAVANCLGADLDQLPPRTRRGARLRSRGHRLGSHGCRAAHGAEGEAPWQRGNETISVHGGLRSSNQACSEPSICTSSPIHIPFFFEAAILSRMRSPRTSSALPRTRTTISGTALGAFERRMHRAPQEFHNRPSRAAGRP
jgi:hypothetical protein